MNKQNNYNNIRHKTFTCLTSNGSKLVSYKDIKEHNENIIMDNMAFGYMHPYDYSIKEINDYERTARKENKEFLRALREDNTGQICVKIDRTTKMYILVK